MGVVVSEEIRLESKDETVKRIKTYFDMRAFSPQEIREYGLATETIQRDDKSYDEFIKSTEAQQMQGNSEGGLAKLGEDEAKEDLEEEKRGKDTLK